MTPTDHDLVTAARAGDLGAFEELVGRHERRVYTLARRMVRHEQDAEDVTQEAFVSALDNLDGFRGEGAFGAWLSRIASHAALKVIRSRRRGQPAAADDAGPGAAESSLPHPEFIADWRLSPARLAERRETAALLDQALDRLDEKHRLVFVLRDVEGYSVKETAAALGLSEANVKVRLLRARLQLREQLTRSFGDPARRVEPHEHG